MISIFFIAIAVVFGLLLSLGSVFESVVFFNAMRCKAKNLNGFTGSQTATNLLETLGMGDIQVKKSQWFTGLFWSNYYNPKKKTIYLRRSIYDKASIASVGVATQQVAFAMQHKNNEKGFNLKSKFQPYIFLAPIVFIPISLLGIIIDLIATKNLSVVSLIFVAIGFALLIAAFVLLIKSIPSEKKANADSLDMMEQTNLLNDPERLKIKKFYKVMILKSIADYIFMTVYFVGLFFKILGKIGNKK